jgi:hypothetical protein
MADDNGVTSLAGGHEDMTSATARERYRAADAPYGMSMSASSSLDGGGEPAQT